MKMKLLPTLVLLWLGTFLACAEPSAPLTVAVFDFESKDEAVEDLGRKVAMLINAELSADPSIITVERAELEKVLGEHELGMSGTVSPDTAAKVGQLTGAKVLVTGRVFKVDKELVMVTKIISTETSRVYGEVVKGASGARVTDLSTQLAKKIAATVESKSDTMVAKVVTREERIEKLKKLLQGKTLPAVSVSIPEHHVSRAVPDPAVQTEIGNILQACGFTLVDGSSDRKADFEITGEAFSEFGLRKGNLQSCRARAEVKVRETATGRIVTVDRQTSAGVDISEQVAAKTALQTAGADLAERIIRQIAR